jgi:hypothetical protein
MQKSRFLYKGHTALRRAARVRHRHRMAETALLGRGARADKAAIQKLRERKVI